MKHSSDKYRVLAQTALFGTVRVEKGDLIPRELLGCNIRRLIDQGIVEPAKASTTKPVQASLI